MDLSAASGAWAGSNGFRLMPTDPLADLPAAATVTTAAGGHLSSFAYTWTHPDDGPQDGLLVFGAEADGPVTALWGDSWHQKPAPMSLTGSHRAGTTVELDAEYAEGWAWRIVIDASDAGNLRVRMDNVVPAEMATDGMPAGPYPVMVMNLRRA